MTRLPTCVFLTILFVAFSRTHATELSQIHVPEGCVVERVASDPVVEHPMCAGFDDRGRLFVAENAGVNLPFTELVKNPPSRILLLEDTDHDGVFDKRTVFADKMVFPTGALWHDGALYVCSVPSVWKLQDTDGDGVADKRTAIVSSFGSIGNGADLHGPYLGPEGWLYFCDGRNGHDLTLGDGTKWKGKAACVYRCRTDGSGLEVVFGGGFDNPVEIAFTPEGEPLVDVNIVQSVPHRVDAILYGIEGSNYPHADPWRELKRTGEFQPSAGDLGWVATSGFMRYRGVALGHKYAGRYFTSQFNPHRVQSHVVQREGAGFHITHEDFLTCDNPDFHPSDVLEDVNGSLLVVDTGGWFRIGCPNSQIAKPDVKGAIYRVRLKQPATHSAEVAVNQRLFDTRLAALAAESKSESSFLKELADVDPAIRREASNGLGRLRSHAAVAPLLDAAAGAAADRFLEHAFIYALIRIGDRNATLAGLRHTSSTSRRAALIALDQMNGGNLTAELVVPHLASDDQRLREAALAIASSHADWAETLVPAMRETLSKPTVEAEEQLSLQAALATFARSPAVQQLVAERLNADPTAMPARLVLLRAIAESAISPLPEAWVEPLRKSLVAPDSAMESIEAIRVTGSAAQFDAELVRLAHESNRPDSLRVAALAVRLPSSKSVDARDFELLTAQLAPSHVPLDRLSASQALGVAPLSPDQLVALAGFVAKAGPLELPPLLSAYERSSDSRVGKALVDALNASKALAGVTPAALTQALAKFPDDVKQSAGALLEKINPDAGAQKAKLAELSPLLKGGDINRGQSVFFNKTASCSTCHAVRGIGAHVGPDLSNIASIRAPNDLLESIVFPSASFARGYEPFVVQTKSNQIQAGVIAGETADAIVLRTPAEVRIPRSSVKSIRQDRVSIMPQGLDAQLNKTELADLLAFLQSLK